MAAMLRRMGGILFSLALVLGLASALAEPTAGWSMTQSCSALPTNRR